MVSATGDRNALGLTAAKKDTQLVSIIAWIGAPRPASPVARPTAASYVGGSSPSPSGWRYECSVCSSGRIVESESPKPFVALSVVPAARRSFNDTKMLGVSRLEQIVPSSTRNGSRFKQNV
jgi:hypothetical protein